AGQAFVVEKKCESLLARCEQCRAGLERKMRQKGFDKEPVAYALDYLERRQFLDDARFAAAWLRSHAVSKCQGRARLAGELAARGISRDIAAAALDAFFAEYDEAALCRKAVAKATRAGRSGDKLVKYLLDSGFSYRLIRAQLERGEP
ncbi:MAG: recombination regulator RecX, partial [Treponemataceae bacterium]|nr:recombination regulator RecX [Treponemataceae bacterium]